MYAIHVDGLSGEVETSYGTVVFDENGDGICTLDQTWAFAGDKGFCVQLLPGQAPEEGSPVEDSLTLGVVVETIPVETEPIVIPDPTAQDPAIPIDPREAGNTSPLEEGEPPVGLEGNPIAVGELAANEPDAEGEGTTPGVVGSSYADLRAMATARGIKYVGVTKADLIAALEAGETPA